MDMGLSNKIKKYGRYKFVDHNGIPKGLENINNLIFAIRTAIEFQCEVIDTQTSTGNQIVYSAWDGWNHDYDFYDESDSEEIMERIKNF